VFVGSYGFSSLFSHHQCISKDLFLLKRAKRIVWCGEQRVSSSCWMWDVSALSVEGHIFSLLSLGSPISTSVNLTRNSKPFAELTEMSNFCYICKHGIQFLCHFLCILLLLSKYLLDNIWPETSSKCQFSKFYDQCSNYWYVENSIKLQLNMAEKSLRNWYLEFKPDIGSN
jgi:hypothetical protein